MIRSSSPIKLHKKLLCHFCPYFDKCFNGGFAEASSEVLDVSSEDPDTALELIRWIYGGTIFENVYKIGHLELCQLWVLADKWCVPKLQNLVVSRLAAEAEERVISGSTMTYVYENTPPGSMLRNITLDICAHNMSHYTFEESRCEYPSEFWPDLCGAIFKKQKNDKENMYGYEKGFRQRESYLVVEDRKTIG